MIRTSLALIGLGFASMLAACTGTTDGGATSDDAATPSDDATGDSGGGGRDSSGDAPAPPGDGARDSRPPGDALGGDTGTKPDGTTGDTGGGGTDTASPLGLHVEGNELVDHGVKVHLHGVNHSGAEYSCVGGYGMIEGPSGDALIKPLLDWKVNVVRVPVNEQCWLGINGLDAKYSGDVYRKAVTDHVNMLRTAGFYVIFDLHWAAPATTKADGQLPMADADHAIEFWKSAADAFKGDPGVIFDVFNEPFLDSGNADTTDAWSCLQHGCTVKGGTTGTMTYGDYKSAGTQDLLDAIRSTGATNVVMIPGLAWTNDLSGWLAHKPTDATGNTVASMHLYNFNACKDPGCWDGAYLAVSKSVPLITGELGEDDCGHGFIDGYMSWADAHGVSYLGWTWNTWDCNKGPALITAYDGTPTGFGQGLRDHLKSL